MNYSEHESYAEGHLFDASRLGNFSLVSNPASGKCFVIRSLAFMYDMVSRDCNHLNAFVCQMSCCELKRYIELIFVNHVSVFSKYYQLFCRVVKIHETCMPKKIQKSIKPQKNVSWPNPGIFVNRSYRHYCL